VIQDETEVEAIGEICLFCLYRIFFKLFGSKLFSKGEGALSVVMSSTK